LPPYRLIKVASGALQVADSKGHHPPDCFGLADVEWAGGQRRLQLPVKRQRLVHKCRRLGIVPPVQVHHGQSVPHRRLRHPRPGRDRHAQTFGHHRLGVVKVALKADQPAERAEGPCPLRR
jgi:hypothetical protein